MTELFDLWVGYRIELRKHEDALPVAAIPCCPVHQRLLKSGQLQPFDNCIVCIRNERDKLKADVEELVKVTGNLIDHWDMMANDTKGYLREVETGFCNAMDEFRRKYEEGR